MIEGGSAISVVLPTYNRADALTENLDTVLGLDDVGEIIVVVDGSSDDTDEVLARRRHPRLRVVRHPDNRGVAAARNSGVDASRGAWVLFAEDDCRFPPDYAIILRSEAERHGASLVGAPLLHLRGGDADAHRVAQSAARVEQPTPEQVGVFPTRPVKTPFVPARVLVRRSVFDEVRFDERYRVNAYREETDFFIQVARAGHTCLFTPATYCWQLDVWRGGAHEARGLRYEYWAVRNNWRFLHRHGAWLADQGYIRSPSLAQIGFSGMRAGRIVRGTIDARLARRRDA